MMTIAQLRAELRLGPADLEQWIAARWVRPERQDGDYVFTEVDIARVRLIREIRYDMGVEESSLPVVLSLLDQVYGLRRQLRCLSKAVAAQPEDVSRSILERFRRIARGD